MPSSGQDVVTGSDSVRAERSVRSVLSGLLAPFERLSEQHRLHFDFPSTDIRGEPVSLLRQALRRNHCLGVCEDVPLLGTLPGGSTCVHSGDWSSLGDARPADTLLGLRKGVTTRGTSQDTLPRVVPSVFSSHPSLTLRSTPHLLCFCSPRPEGEDGRHLPGWAGLTLGRYVSLCRRPVSSGQSGSCSSTGRCPFLLKDYRPTGRSALTNRAEYQ